MLGEVSEAFRRSLTSEQEILFNISDMIMQVYASESALLRLEKLEGMKGADAVGIYKDIVDVFVYDAADTIHKAGKDAINSFAQEEEDYDALMGYINKLTTVKPVNVKAARRRIAAYLIEENSYSF